MVVAEHLSDKDIADLIARKLAPPFLLTVTRHVALCSLCAARIKNASSSDRREIAFGQIKPEHLEYEQFEAYIDGRLEEVDREIIDNHLSICDQCFREIGELNSLKAELSAGANVIAIESKKRSWWQGSSTTMRVALAVAAMLVVSFGIWLVWQSQRTAPIAVIPKEIDKAGAAETSDKPPVENPGPMASLANSPVALNDNGVRVTIDNEGNLSGLPNLPDAQQELIKQTLSRQSFTTSSAIKELVGHTSTLMGSPSDDAGFKVLGPKGTLIRTDRPTFRWQPLTGADSYTVTILDGDFHILATSPELNETEWTSSVALSRKTVYLWQVTAIKNGKRITSPAAPAPEARFMILDQSKIKDLDQAAQASNKSHLVVGSLYVQAGLLDDAEREFRALIRENPDSPLAKKILKQVRSLRP